MEFARWSLSTNLSDGICSMESIQCRWRNPLAGGLVFDGVYFEHVYISILLSLNFLSLSLFSSSGMYLYKYAFASHYRC